MKKWIIKSIMLSLVLLFSGCFVSGKVKDESGNAIAGAEVTVKFSDGNKVTYTNNKGKYRVNTLFNQTDDNDEVLVVVNKDNYKEVQKTVQLINRKARANFVLEELDNDVIVGTLNGTIKDTLGMPLENVNIKVGAINIYTDENGSYSLDLNVSDAVSVTADLENYAQNSRVVNISENNTTTLNLILVKVDKIVVFNSNDGVEIQTKGSKVVINPSSIVNEDGIPYIGNVTAKVSFNQVSSSVGREAFPGDYIGLQENSEEAVLQSYGFIDVTLSDENSNLLQLANGEVATLTFPMDSTINDTPATIPLWYYDTEQGIWVEDGLATYDLATNTYIGDVTHFTTWNLDKKLNNPGSFEGCIEDNTSHRIQISDLIVNAPGMYKHIINNDVNGTFKFINSLTDVNITIQAIVNDMASAPYEFILAPGENKIINECLVIDMEAPETHFINGQIINSDGSGISYSYVQIMNSQGNTLGSFYTYNEGILNPIAFNRPEDNIIILNISAYINGNYITVTNEYLLDEFSDNTNLGLIEIQTTRVDGCIDIIDLNTSGYNNNIKLDSPFGNVATNIDANGNFSYYTVQNYLDQTAYAFMDNYVGSFTYNRDSDIVDLTSNCIILEEAIDINISVDANITSSNPDVVLKVIYLNDSEMYEYGEEILIDTNTSGTFNLTKNGIYRIMQSDVGYNLHDFDGTISITINGVLHEITIPSGSQSYGDWLGLTIEVYQGEITIIEENREYYGNMKPM